MSTLRTFLGGWYIDTVIGGQKFAVLLPNNVVRTHLADLTPPPGQTPLYVCVTNTPVFRLAGQAWNVPGTSVYSVATGWELDPRIAHGNFGCIFDLTGTLRIIQPAANQTSQGYRYVHADGTPEGHLVLGDETQLLNGVSAFTDLSAAQDGSLLVGQGHDAGGVVVFIEGTLRLLQAGECYDVRAYLDGQQVTISFYDVKPDGLTAYIWDGTLDELRALPAMVEAPVQPPKIAVGSYNARVKAGEPWHLAFANDGDGTRFLVTKDAEDRLWVEAQNAAGSDHTGKVRQLTVEGPTPPEPPPMPTLERFWYQPNVGSRDLLAVDMASLAHVQVVVLPVQCVLTDQPGGQVGENTYPNLAAAGFFRALKESGIALVIEAGALKEFDCTGASSRAQIQAAVDRVADAGGAIAAFSMDEPLTGNTIPNAEGRACNLPLPVCVDVMVAYIQQVHALGILCGWLEAFPRIPFDQLKECLRLLNARGALPDYMHADIEWPATTDAKAATFTHAMQQECAKYGVTYGAFINSQKDPCATDQVHDAAVMQLAPKIHAIVPDVAHVCVASWVRRVKDGPQDVPNNLGQFGLIDTFEKARTLFQPTIPVDQPPPVETFPMDYKLVDYVIGIKALKPSAAGGRVTAILPDDRVASMQPDGSFGTRAAGTDAAYEQAIERDKLLLYEPIPGKRYAAGYRVVA